MKQHITLSLLLLLVAAIPACAQSSTPTLLWPAPPPIPYPAPLTVAQLNAIALPGPPVLVPLSSSFNVTGITSAGKLLLGDGGFDHVGRAFPVELIGRSISWRGIDFPLGPSDAPDAVTDIALPLPEGHFGSLLMLGSLVDDVLPPNGTFTVAYTDGTSSTSSQDFSDWVVPLNYPGETIAACYPYRYWVYGPIERYSVCVYGYSIPLDPSKTVKSVQLPQTRFVVMLAAALVPPALEGTIIYTPAAGTVLPPGPATLTANFSPAAASAAAAEFATASVPINVQAPPAPIQPAIVWPQPQPIPWGTELTSVELNAAAETYLSPTPVPLGGYVRAKVIDHDGALYLASGVDGHGQTYSAEQLGPVLAWLGVDYPLGAGALPDAATSASIPLPSASYNTLYLLGTAGRQAEPAQPFTVTYTDGGSETTSIDLSAWNAPQHYAGETIVSTSAYADTRDGNRIPGLFYVYGYRISLDPTRSVASLQLPHNLDVMILAAALGTSADLPVPGSLTYAPSFGAILPEGTNPLSVAFAPVNPSLFTPAAQTNSILVTEPGLSLNANDAQRVYGMPNPAFDGSVTGAVMGDTFVESFSTSAMPLTAPGAYPIVPSVSGRDVSQYRLTVNDGTLTIAKSPVQATVQVNGANFAQGAPVTLAASIASTSAGSPGGTVQFLADGTALGTAALVQGKASLTTSALLPGANDLKIVYSGDANFLGASASAAVTIEAFDFRFDAPAGTALHATWGHQSSLSLHLAPRGIVYQSNVTFAVAGVDDALSSTHFSPQIVGSQAGPATVLLTVTLDNLAETQHPGPNTNGYLPLAALLAIPLIAGAKRARTRHHHLLFLALSAITLVPALSGCGSGYRKVSVPLSVTATDGTHTHTLALTLEISGPE